MAQPSGEIRVRVECYAGRKADERPVRFYLRQQKFDVEEVLDQWYSPEAVYFRVRAHDGHFYILCHNEAQDVWTLESFRRSPQAAG